ncbi:hypothetical protein N8B52_14940 (plasmid) [Enterococcus faecium]
MNDTDTIYSKNKKFRNRETGLNAQIVQRHFMMEQLIEQISESKYKNDFILKGGFLIRIKIWNR